MPAVSGKQYRLMQAAAHGKLKSAGPSPEVAKEFISKTSPKKRKLWSRKGG
jgi:hypothetical protein